MPNKQNISNAESDMITYTPENREDDKLLTLQNVFVVAAALIFLAGQFISALKAYHLAVNGTAYIMGAAAYITELLVLTDRFRKHRHIKELFMPYVFGTLYIILGISYFVKHFI